MLFVALRTKKKIDYFLLNIVLFIVKAIKLHVTFLVLTWTNSGDRSTTCYSTKFNTSIMVSGLWLSEFALWTHAHKHTTLCASKRKKNRRDKNTQSQYAFENWTYRSPICDKFTFFAALKHFQSQQTWRRSNRNENISYRERKNSLLVWATHSIRLAENGFILNVCTSLFVYGNICANEICLSNAIKSFCEWDHLTF